MHEYSAIRRIARVEELLIMSIRIRAIFIIVFTNMVIIFFSFANEDIPLYLFGDELRVKQVLNNLLSNAFKYTKEGHVRLSFNSRNIAKDETVLIISVSDTGQGMTKKTD